MAQKQLAQHAERLLKGAKLEIAPGGTMIRITFRDESHIDILTERSFNWDEVVQDEINKK